MLGIKWENEPDLILLRESYELILTNPSSAQMQLEELAYRGSIMSMWYLADGYMSGYFGEKDIEKSKFWFRRAQPVWPMASYYLGVAHLESDEYADAAEAFSYGVDHGCMSATYRLAKLYSSGHGVEHDIIKYRCLLEDACKKGHLFSKRDLAALYISGKFGFFMVPIGFFMLISLALDLVLFFVSGLISRNPIDERLII